MSAKIPVFRNDPVVVLILGIVTCGFYSIYWNLKAAEVLNAVAGRQAISPTLAAVSGLYCCLPVTVYFYYQCGQLMGDLGRVLGKEEEFRDKAALLLILALVFTPVVPMIIQGHLNELYDLSES
jgi:hypothetical protein